MIHRDLARSLKLDEERFRDFYDEISHDWEQRALLLQARRWQKIRNRTIRNKLIAGELAGLSKGRML